MHVALSAWFAGRANGSGQYLDQLHGALRATAAADESYALLHPPGRPDGLSKLAWEQLGFPRAAVGHDLAHVPYWAPPLRPTLPTLVTIHDLIPLLLPDYRRRPSVRAYTELVRRASPAAAAILTDSEHSAGDIRRHLDVDPERVHAIPLGIADRFRPQASSDCEGFRERAELPSRFGLYLGGFDRRKNLITLLRAWVDVHRATGLPLVLAGKLPPPSDPLHPRPLDLARRAGLLPDVLHLPGFIPDADLPLLYASAALFAFPSSYEGFGLPPLEAMACGTPVVAADATSLPEVVGEAGILAAPDDPAAWTEACRRILEDPGLATRLSEAGIAQAARFPWSSTAQRTRDVYHQTLRRSRG